MFFFNDEVHGNNLLRFGPVGSHVAHKHYHSLSILGLHMWPMSSLIHHFKFSHSLSAGKILCRWFVDKKQHCTLAVPHLLLPVPISAWRLATRHYNQAGVIAEYLSKQLGIPCLHQWAKRTGASTQHQLTKAQRKDNAKQAFSLVHHAAELIACNSGEKLNVAIVDDVITTGVTVNMLSYLLRKRYPNITIQVWAMTFTPPPKSSLLKI